MQAATARQPDRMRGLQRGEPFTQQRLGMAKRQILLIPFRGYADPCREKPLKVRRTHLHLGGQFSQ